MAPVKLKNVVSFSSQDADHCASNLLESNQWRRWLCALGDRSGSVQAEFQLERAVKIGFIDIGNCGSALIEILVRRSSASDDQFKTLVPTTSCMTPMDSKQGKNKTAVKMFSRDQLCEDARDEYWDRIKIVCRQPFKKETQFGLAFIKISSLEEKESGSERSKVMHTVIKQPVQKPKPVQKQPDRAQVLSPSWKSNTAFKKTFAALNQGESSATSDLKHRLVRIESTSESKSQSGYSLGRAAQLILAASGKRTPSSPSSQVTVNNENSSAAAASSSPLATTPVASSSSSIPAFKRGKGKNKMSILDHPPDEAVILLEEQVKEFLSHVGPALKDATLTELRPKFESCLGRKLAKNEKAIFKRLAIHAVEALDDPAGVDIPDIGLRRTSKKETGWLQAKPTPNIPDIGLGRTGSNNGRVQAKPTPSTSSEYLSKNNVFHTPGMIARESEVKGRQLPPWMNSSAQPGEGKPCPKCGGKYPASRMNIHILDCRGQRESTSINSSNSRSPASLLKRRANTPVHGHSNGSATKRHIGGGVSGGGTTATDDLIGDKMMMHREEECTPTRGGRGNKRGATGRTGRGRGRKNNGLTSTPGQVRGQGRGRGRGRGRGVAKAVTNQGNVALSVEFIDTSSSSDDDNGVGTSTEGRGRGQRGVSRGRGGRGQTRGRGIGRGRGRKSTSTELPNPWTKSSPSSSDVTDDELDRSHNSGREAPTTFDMVPCPICMQEFPQCTIANHAAFCGEPGGAPGGVGLGGFGVLSGGFLRDVEAAIWVD